MRSSKAHSYFNVSIKQSARKMTERELSHSFDPGGFSFGSPAGGSVQRDGVEGEALLECTIRDAPRPRQSAPTSRPQSDAIARGR